MPVESSLQSLSLYDVLTDVIPGAVVLLFIYLLLPIDDVVASQPAGIFASVAVIGSFIIGHLIQWIRGWCLFRQPGAFQQTIDAVRLRRGDDPRDDEVSSSDDIDHDLSSEPLHAAFLDEVNTYFDLDSESDTERFRLVLSYLTTQPSTRTHRFQSLYSFYRSMYVASVISFLLTVTTAILAATGFASCSDKLIPCEGERSKPLISSFCVGIAKTV